MSVIFGIHNKKINNIIEYSLNRLCIWNDKYKYNSYKKIIDNNIGLGCFPENLSKNYSDDNSIIKINNHAYILDSLIFNRKELFERLDNKNKNFSDELLLANIIEQFGFQALSYVNGDFAGVSLIDGQITLFTNHSATRPIFYYTDDNKFVFSTDMRAILCLPDVDNTINENVLYKTWKGIWDPSPTETHFKKIKRLEPATYMTIKSSHSGFLLVKHSYWKPCKQKIKYKNIDKYKTELKKLIIDAIDIRASVFSGPIGAELSAGLDSSIIDIYLNRLKYKTNLVSWSPSYTEVPKQENDERQIIEDICKQENTKCYYLPKLSTNIYSLVKNLAPPYINTLQISASSKYLKENGSACVFTGLGGDELVSHRCNIYELLYHKELISFFKELLHLTKGKPFRILRLLKLMFYYVFIFPKKLYYKWIPDDIDKLNLLKKNFVKKKKRIKNQIFCFGYNPKKYIALGSENARIDNVVLQGGLNKVRYLMPFLDYRIVDFALSIPRKLFYHHGIDRWIYRETFKYLMPKSLQIADHKETPQG